MNLHLVGGFLGSGKTTAIIQAAKMLMMQGRRVGVITNDQGKYLVDTAFFRLSEIPAVEVSGGCFCCNYADLESSLAQLMGDNTSGAHQPDVIFAESVGSCADLVATVVKPLLELSRSTQKPASFSVFSDARLLRRRLLGLEMPFSEDVTYIFDKQLEEAGLLVVNKVDLLAPADVDEMRTLLQTHYPGRPYRLQSSLTPDGVRPWLDELQSGDLVMLSTPLEIDYARYGAGEARLAWLDETVELRFLAGTGQHVLRQVLLGLTSALAERRAGIGHLKFILSGSGVATKLSFPTLEEPGWEARIPAIPGESVRLLINARVEMDASVLSALLRQVLDKTGARYAVGNGAAFHPQQPKPTYRFA